MKNKFISENLSGGKIVKVVTPVANGAAITFKTQYHSVADIKDGKIFVYMGWRAGDYQYYDRRDAKITAFDLESGNGPDNMWLQSWLPAESNKFIPPII